MIKLRKRDRITAQQVKGVGIAHEHLAGTTLMKKGLEVTVPLKWHGLGRTATGVNFAKVSNVLPLKLPQIVGTGSKVENINLMLMPTVHSSTMPVVLEVTQHAAMERPGRGLM